MNPILFEIGSFKIYYYGLMYGIAFFLGTELGKKLAIKRGISPKLIDNYAIVVMLSGLLGGRLYYVLFNYEYYFANSSEILAFWKGGMAIHGGIFGGIIGTVIFGKLNKIKPFLLADIAVAPLLLGQALGRIGNFMNGEVHGVPTFTPWNIIFTVKPSFSTWYEKYLTLSLEAQAQFKELVPWGLVFPNTSPAGYEFPLLSLHPAMLYESLLNFIGFFILIYLLRKKTYAVGVISCIYIIIYSINRIIISFFRAEDLMLYSVRAPHFISLLLIVFSTVIIYFLSKKTKS